MNNASSPYRHTMATATSILAWILAAAAMLMLASCQMHAFGDPDDDDDDTQTETMQVVLMLRLDDTEQVGSAKGTRADGVPDNGDGTNSWDGNYTSEADASDAESRIDVSRLHIVFYNSDGSVFGVVRNLQLAVNKTDKSLYRVMGVMPVQLREGEETYTFDGKIGIYANTDMPNVEASFNNNLPDNLTYSYTTPLLSQTTDNTGAAQALEAIPMWGVYDCSGDKKLTFRRGSIQTPDLTVNLLRAMAKVTVDLSDHMKDDNYSFETVELFNYSASGYVMPAATTGDDFSLTTLASTEFLTYAQSFHPTGNVNTTEGSNSINFLGVPGDQQSLTLYIPEYRNVNTDGSVAADYAYIHVKLNKEETPSGDDTREGWIRFRKYTDGKGQDGTDFNIVRNHHYKFTVYNNHLDVRLHVEHWNVVSGHQVIDI